uniref:MYXO-CTERM sorting domain-containing protein n=1 Tax=Thermus thermophilus TaxID=274 RepID=UPI00194E0AD9
MVIALKVAQVGGGGWGRGAPHRGPEGPGSAPPGRPPRPGPPHGLRSTWASRFWAGCSAGPGGYSVWAMAPVWSAVVRRLA